MPISGLFYLATPRSGETRAPGVPLTYASPIQTGPKGEAMTSNVVGLGPITATWRVLRLFPVAWLREPQWQSKLSAPHPHPTRLQHRVHYLIRVFEGQSTSHITGLREMRVDASISPSLLLSPTHTKLSALMTTKCTGCHQVRRILPESPIDQGSYPKLLVAVEEF